MKFKQLQALKKRAYQAFADGKRLDVPDQDAAHLDSINLAFVGDAYYALTRKFAFPQMPKTGFDVYLLDRKVIEVLQRMDEPNSALRQNSYPPRPRPMSTAASTTA